LDFFSELMSLPWKFLWKFLWIFPYSTHIACIMLLKPMLARSPRSFRNLGQQMLSNGFLNNSNKKNAHTTCCWHSSNYLITHCFPMFHICRTTRRHFSLRQVKLCIGQRKCKQKLRTQGVTDWSTKRVNSRSLT